jgi:hypothetical protein
MGQRGNMSIGRACNILTGCTFLAVGVWNLSSPAPGVCDLQPIPHTHGKSQEGHVNVRVLLAAQVTMEFSRGPLILAILHITSLANLSSEPGELTPSLVPGLGFPLHHILAFWWQACPCPPQLVLYLAGSCYKKVPNCDLTRTRWP